MILRLVNLFRQELFHFEEVLEILQGKKSITLDKKVVIIRIFLKEEREKESKRGLSLFKNAYPSNGMKERDGDY